MLVSPFQNERVFYAQIIAVFLKILYSKGFQTILFTLVLNLTPLLSKQVYAQHPSFYRGNAAMLCRFF